MSTNNYILNLLNIKDKNIYILTNNEIYKKIKNKNYRIIEGILTYTPDYCPCCGIINESHDDIIKWGFKKIVKLKYLIFLIANLYYFFTNRDFIVNTVVILLLLKQT